MNSVNFIKRWSAAIPKLVSKRLDFVRGQDVIRFKNGAYTLVREYFEADHNTAIGQKMNVLKQF